MADDSRPVSAGVSSSLTAGRISASCPVDRALAIGATTCGRVSSQAIATAAGVVRRAAATWFERLERGAAALGEVLAGPLGARRVDLRAARPVLAGQEPAGQRVVGQHGQVPLVRDGRERALVVPLDKVVVRLQHREFGEPQLALQPECLGQPLRRVVGGGDVPDHPVGDQGVERAQRLLERRLLIVVVHVVQVDIVGLQPVEGGVRLAADIVRPQVPVPGVTPAADLRGEHDLVAVAALFQPAPDERLGPAVLDQVRVGGVDEVAARLGIGVEHGARLLLVGGPPEHVAAQAEGKDVQVRTAKENHAAEPIKGGVPRSRSGSRCRGSHHQSQQTQPSQSKISQLTDVLHRNLQKYLCCNENLMRIRPVLGLPRGQPERDPQSPYRPTEGTA